MKKHILVVDQDQFILYGLAKALKDDGCEVKTADSANEAIEKLSFCPYDLCLLDVQLSVINEGGILKVINDICPKTQVILMTADPLDSPEFSNNDQAVVDQGADYCIAKPFALNDVTEIVKLVLAGEGEKTDQNDFFKSDPETKSRKHDRTSCNEVLNFGASVIHEGYLIRLSLNGQVIDKSDGGIGLLTSYPLRENQVIGFDEKMNYRIGVVAWSRMIDKECFRIGIRFA
ncbi:MAG: response regulator [Deltaproteobacteria bacterium]|jgi:CheY-like chemotaxis protein|nr:response regulator [Deltaproteobacteria bacterium]